MIDKIIAANNIVELQGIFKNSFAIYGTALGSLRERDIIDHDLDTDLGIIDSDFIWEQVTQSIKQGFSIISIFGLRFHGLEISLRKNGVKTDIMIFYERSDGDIYNCLWDNGGRNGLSDAIIHEYDSDVFKIIDGYLGENKIRTLGEDYIKAVYGDNWREPVKTWDWRKDHLCRQK